jgi:hypothetical protein
MSNATLTKTTACKKAKPTDTIGFMLTGTFSFDDGVVKFKTTRGTKQYLANVSRHKLTKLRIKLGKEVEILVRPTGPNEIQILAKL